MQTVKIAIDTYYRSDSDAYTVGVLFENWQDSKPKEIISCHTSSFAPYIPGQFYKREMPCILDLLKQINISNLDTIILDGFVKLPERDGLGMHLWKELGLPSSLSIVGVAKTRFDKCESIALPVYRGKTAIKPLWVNTNGLISNEEAVDRIKQMHGDFRIPDLLKLLDKETKKLI